MSKSNDISPRTDYVTLKTSPLSSSKNMSNEMLPDLDSALSEGILTPTISSDDNVDGFQNANLIDAPIPSPNLNNNTERAMTSGNTVPPEEPRNKASLPAPLQEGEHPGINFKVSNDRQNECQTAEQILIAEAKELVFLKASTPAGRESSVSSNSSDSWPLPFENDVSLFILGMLPRQSLWAFASASRASYLIALPLLYRHAQLPLPDADHSFGVSEGVDLGDYVREATVDLSDPVFRESDIPVDTKIRKALHGFKNLKHLIIKRSSQYASDAVLGSLFRYLIEQWNLQELTFELDYRFSENGLVNFRTKLERAWSSVHKSAFHKYTRQLATLNFAIRNPAGSLDGLDEMFPLLRIMLETVQTLRIDVVDTLYFNGFTDPSRPLYHSYFKLLSSVEVKSIEVKVDGAAQKPYSEIVVNFPFLESLKMEIKDCYPKRTMTELTCLSRLKYLRELDIPWAYPIAGNYGSGMGGMVIKAKDKAKGVIQQRTSPDDKDLRDKSIIRRFTKNLIHNHDMFRLENVTWRHRQDNNGEESRLTFLVYWDDDHLVVRELLWDAEGL